MSLFTWQNNVAPIVINMPQTASSLFVKTDGLQVLGLASINPLAYIYDVDGETLTSVSSGAMNGSLSQARKPVASGDLSKVVRTWTSDIDTYSYQLQTYSSTTFVAEGEYATIGNPIPVPELPENTYGFGTLFQMSSDGSTLIVTDDYGKYIWLYKWVNNDWVFQQRFGDGITYFDEVTSNYVIPFMALSSNGTTFAILHFNESSNLQVSVYTFDENTQQWSSQPTLYELSSINFKGILMSGDGQTILLHRASGLGMIAEGIISENIFTFPSGIRTITFDPTLQYTLITFPNKNSQLYSFVEGSYSTLGDPFILSYDVTDTAIHVSNTTITAFLSNGFFTNGSSSIDVYTMIIDYNIPDPEPENIISNTCFVKDTRVYVDQEGWMCIQDIVPGKHTIGKMAVERITKTTTLEQYLVCMHANAFADRFPKQNIICSQNHMFLIDGEWIKAKDLVDGVNVVLTPVEKNTILYNVLLADNVYGVMNVEGLIVETLHPTNSLVAFYRLKEQLPVEQQHALVHAANVQWVKQQTLMQS